MQSWLASVALDGVCPGTLHTALLAVFGPLKGAATGEKVLGVVHRDEKDQFLPSEGHFMYKLETIKNDLLAGPATHFKCPANHSESWKPVSNCIQSLASYL